jgi:hypothetical protein
MWLSPGFDLYFLLALNVLKIWCSTFRDSNWLIPLEEAQAREWEHFSFRRFVRSIRTELCHHFLLFLLQRFFYINL